jgi:hypothetical protein
MHSRVTTEQFQLNGDKLTHVPTGATFWMGEKDVVCCEPGHLSLESGDDYELDEIKNESWRLSASRASSAIVPPILPPTISPPTLSRLGAD